jgi:hypothetical protein
LLPRPSIRPHELRSPVSMKTASWNGEVDIKWLTFSIFRTEITISNSFHAGKVRLERFV